jgi:hypothetical protein
MNLELFRRTSKHRKLPITLYKPGVVKCGFNADNTTSVLLEKDLELKDQVQYLEMILDNKMNWEQLH